MTRNGGYAIHTHWSAWPATKGAVQCKKSILIGMVICSSGLALSFSPGFFHLPHLARVIDTKPNGLTSRKGVRILTVGLPSY